MLGQTIDDRYHIEALVGQGGLGRVYRALDKKEQRLVAVKVLNEHAMGRRELVQRMQREVRICQAVSHPNVVDVLDFGHTSTGAPYLVMDFIEAPTLEDVLESSGPMTPERTIGICRQVLLALDHLHGAGAVHRDIKPANLMLEADGRVVLLDFGLATADDCTALTKTGMRLGTPWYMAPETVKGGESSARSDLYAVGLIAYECLSGHNPFASSDLASVFQRVCTHIPEPLSLSLGFSKGWDSWFERALSKSPNDRFQTAQSMLNSLSAIEGDIDDSVETSVCRPSEEQVPRRPALLVGATVVMFILIAAAVMVIKRPGVAVVPVVSNAVFDVDPGCMHAQWKTNHRSIARLTLHGSSTRSVLGESDELGLHHRVALSGLPEGEQIEVSIGEIAPYHRRLHIPLFRPRLAECVNDGNSLLCRIAARASPDTTAVVRLPLYTGGMEERGLSRHSSSLWEADVSGLARNARKVELEFKYPGGACRVISLGSLVERRANELLGRLSNFDPESIFVRASHAARDLLAKEDSTRFLLSSADSWSYGTKEFNDLRWLWTSHHIERLLDEEGYRRIRTELNALIPFSLQRPLLATAERLRLFEALQSLQAADFLSRCSRARRSVYERKLLPLGDFACSLDATARESQTMRFFEAAGDGKRAIKKAKYAQPD